MVKTLRLAVAQSAVPEDPTDPRNLRTSGAQIRALMREASRAGARLVQFPEGAITYPGKYVMSSAGPSTLAEADWARMPWGVLEEEKESIAALAGDLGLWVAFGAPNPLGAALRPHNSVHVVRDTGEFALRYDKRMLSHTEASFMYTPGTAPGVFVIDGIRFGIAVCIEAHFPELFAEYERLDVDCVLLPVMVDDAMRAVIAQAYAALYGYWIGYAVPAQYSATVPSGIVAPGGRWLARCPGDNRPALAVTDIDLDASDSDIHVSLRYARPWRRAARTELAGRNPAFGGAHDCAKTVL
ncbi:carbon-nitrogen hydrolase family protein [Streptomyces mangrovisoli]|uniref:carbon-nitrogen hydrolase family protein n=1 Tax=Streptomyces mangrovisoli TaxID=1428628 RepID=UPI001F0AE663|nr:carbon-nitrogen hydrolase family protein [Streptomyces mangrovisoli]